MSWRDEATPVDVGPAYPPWEEPPLPGGPPTTPGGDRTVRSGVGLRTAALVGTGHRIPILFGRGLISPDIVYAGMGGFYRGEFRVVLSEGPIDAVEDWLTDTANFDTLTVTLGTMATPAANLQGTIGLAAAFIRTKPGRPYQPRCIARGRKPYDPRLGAWGAGFYPDPTKCAYSTNPALCMADLKTFPQYGTGWPTVTPARVDWQSVEDAADYCDTLVSGAKRYELNLYIQNGGDAKLWEDTIGLHAGLRWREEGGLWYLDYSGPVATAADPITTDHLVEDSTPRLVSAGGAGLADRPNVFTAEWIDPLAGWITRTVTVRHPAVEAGLEAERPARVYQLHGFQTEVMAHRALWRIAHEVWAEQTLEADLTTERLDLVEGSRVPVVLPSVGLAGAEYLVTKTTYDADIVRITARRYDADTWTPVGGSENALDDPGFFDVPGDLTAVARVALETEVTATIPTSKTTVTFLGFEWELPTFAWPKDVIIRVWPVAASPTWDTAGYVEFIVPAEGDARFADDPTWAASLRTWTWDTTVKTYDQLGTEIATASDGAGFKAILRLRSLAGQLSTGVAVNEALHSSSGSTPADVVPVVTDADVDPDDGLLGIWDAAAGQLRFPSALALVQSSRAATLGGRILVGPTVRLAADLAAAATTISVSHNTLASGDRIYLEGAPGGVAQAEWLAVTSGASGTGPYTYSVTRDLDASGANDWTKGDAIFNTGQTGTPWLDIYWARGVKSSGEVGPSIVGNVRDSATWNAWTPRWVVGNLKGLYGYAVDTFGAAFGVPTGPWLKIDATNGIRIGHNATTKVSVNASGDAAFTGSITAAAGSIGGLSIGADKIYLGAGNFFNSDTPFYAGSSGHFSLSDKFKWDTSDLTILAGNVTLDGNGIKIPEGGATGANGFNIASGGTPYGGVYGSSGNILVGRISGAMLQFESSKIIAVGHHEADAFTTRTSAPTSGYFDTGNGYMVLGVQVVGARAAAVADATDAASVIARLNDLLARLRAHGLIYS